MEPTKLSKHLMSLLAYNKAYDLLKHNFHAGIVSLKMRKYHEEVSEALNVFIEGHPDPVPSSVRELFAKQDEKDYLIKDDKIHELLILPLIMNISFLNEVALKTLILLNDENNNAHGHFLSDLFAKLEPDQQNNIKQATQLSDVDFNTLIQENKNHFVEWRYFYEDKNGNLNTPQLDFLENFYKAIEAEIVAKIPS